MSLVSLFELDHSMAADIKSRYSHKKIDVLEDPEVTHRRLRIEWPLPEAGLEDVFAEARMRHGENPEDNAVYEQLVVNNPHWRGVPKKLHRRARRQSTSWDTFEILARTDLVDAVCFGSSGFHPPGAIKVAFSVVDLHMCFDYSFAAGMAAEGGGISLHGVAWHGIAICAGWQR
ncbi:MAG: hypothetical protein LQ340_002426 [Diploschistes diacapsis]|nr:MAG: hypothetical protein LQ340_002426 [Diploschistes diacapsis]